MAYYVIPVAERCIFLSENPEKTETITISGAGVVVYHSFDRPVEFEDIY